MDKVRIITPICREEYIIMQNMLSTLNIVDTMFLARENETEYSSVRIRKIAEKIADSVSEQQINNLIFFTSILQKCAIESCMDVEIEK